MDCTPRSRPVRVSLLLYDVEMINNKQLMQEYESWEVMFTPL